MLVNFEDVPVGIKVQFIFGHVQLQLHCISSLHHVVRSSHQLCRKKIFRRSFHTPFKTWPTFCFNVSCKELWVIFIQIDSEVVSSWRERRRLYQHRMETVFSSHQKRLQMAIKVHFPYTAQTLLFCLTSQRNKGKSKRRICFIKSQDKQCQS